jgi:hypothetical protein
MNVQDKYSKKKSKESIWKIRLLKIWNPLFVTLKLISLKIWNKYLYLINTCNKEVSFWRTADAALNVTTQLSLLMRLRTRVALLHATLHYHNVVLRHRGKLTITFGIDASEEVTDDMGCRTSWSSG